MNCNQCSTDFEISNEDQQFLKRFDVPEPTLCPTCRQQRRMAFRNERTLYKRKCDLSGESFIGIYPEDSPYKVYGPNVWYTDRWDATEYGREFDFSRPFFEQYAELQKDAPRIGQVVVNLENCPYLNQVWYSKDCYMCFDMGFTERAMYCDAIYYCNDTVDCTSMRESSFSYFLVDCRKCNNCMVLQDCKNCSDSYFSYDCQGCENIAFSSNLRNKKNHIFNKPVSEEEFKQVVSDIKSGFYAKWQEYMKKFKEKVFGQAIHKENHNLNTENCIGDYLQNCKNCHYCYDCADSEDLRYVTRADEKIKTAMDLDNCSMAEVIYDSLTISGHNIKFSFNSFHPNNANFYYCDTMMNCQDCFGCTALRNKKYCILNKQYSKEEYETLIPKILEHMKNTPYPSTHSVRSRSGAEPSSSPRGSRLSRAGSKAGSSLGSEWGEFFPVTLSPFDYNETVAQEFHPMIKDTVLDRGWKWRDSDQKDYQSQSYRIPDSLSETSDEITNEILACTECGKNYKITLHELKFYRNMGLPIPRKCNNCRHRERFVLRNPHKFFQRKCDQCQKDIFTSYSPSQQEKVYCEACYLKKVY